MSASDRCRHAGKFRVVLKGAIVLPESRSPVETMRTMNISPFPKPVEIADIGAFTNARLAEKFTFSEQGAALAGYMFYPVTEATRTSFGSALRSVPDPLRLNLKGMSRIQNRWLRATDVFHIYYDMTIGGHQARRGGATISKAVHLAAKNTKSLGTSEATFWSAWKAYKDVATAVTATVLIWDNTRRVFKNEYLAAFRTHDDAEPITLNQLSPFHIVLLMPDFVLAVARSFENIALTKINNRVDTGFDPETLWRIPEEINVSPVPPPPRRIRVEDTLILNARRAGNRGRRNRQQTDGTFSEPL
jgi:hypothetical protein